MSVIFFFNYDKFKLNNCIIRITQINIDFFSFLFKNSINNKFKDNKPNLVTVLPSEKDVNEIVCGKKGAPPKLDLKFHHSNLW